MPNPVLAPAIARMRAKLEASLAEGVLTPEDLASADRGLALSAEDHFQYQTIQSEAHAGGDLHTDDAMIVYVALGEVGDPDNGLWATDTDLATKYAVTTTIAAILKRAAGVA